MIMLGSVAAEKHIKLHLLKGDVLIWKDFEFNDGSAKDPRFILLTDCRDGHFLAIRVTTKNLELYENGKIYKEFIIMNEGEDPIFERRTVIDIQKIHLLEVDKMKNIFGEKITRNNLFQLSLAKIDELVVSSKLMRRDWKKWSSESQRSEYI